jgi:tetratricopeptide (TPR) repeat protein
MHNFKRNKQVSGHLKHLNLRYIPMDRKIEISKQIDLLFDHENYQNARKILLKELKGNPNDHWLLTRISTTFYEEKKYKKALEFSQKAIQLAPNCPLTQWDHASDLEMTGDVKKAIKIWLRLLSMDTEKIANGLCGEGIARAKALQMDCAFRLGIAYRDLKNPKESKKYFDLHLNLRYPGNCSIYRRKYAIERIKKQPLTRTV